MLALALVRPWGRAIPRRLLLTAAWAGRSGSPHGRAEAGARRLLLTAAWAGSVVLTAYGALMVVAGMLVLTGVITPSGPVDRTALRWHVMLWDLWFLVWGVLLGVAAWHSGRRPPARA